MIQMQINSLDNPDHANGLNFHVNLQTGEYRVSYQKDGVWMGHGILALKNDLKYSLSTVVTIKGISFAIKTNSGIGVVYIGGSLKEQVVPGAVIGVLPESFSVAGYIEFLVFDLKNNQVYTMTIDQTRSVRCYGAPNSTVPSGAQLRGSFSFFKSQ